MLGKNQLKLKGLCPSWYLGPAIPVDLATVILIHMQLNFTYILKCTAGEG